METVIHSARIIELRKAKAWSQQYLSDVAGLSLRTVQRIENHGAGSNDSLKAIAMAFDLTPADLMQPRAPKEVANVSNRSNMQKYLIGFTSVVALLSFGSSMLLSASPNDVVQPQVIQSSMSTLVTDTAEAQLVVERAALEWLTLIDKGEYQQSWEQSDSIVKQQVTASQWSTAIQQTRTHFGALKSRELASAQFPQSLPGLPDGQYAILMFNTQFGQKNESVETVSLSGNNGEWKVMGYFIR